MPLTSTADIAPSHPLPANSGKRMAVVGEVLRLETPLTFAEIVTAVREYALEDPVTGLYEILTPEYIAWCLIHLLEYGMAGVVEEGAVDRGT